MKLLSNSRFPTDVAAVLLRIDRTRQGRAEGTFTTLSRDQLHSGECEALCGVRADAVVYVDEGLDEETLLNLRVCLAANIPLHRAAGTVATPLTQ